MQRTVRLRGSNNEDYEEIELCSGRLYMPTVQRKTGLHNPRIRVGPSEYMKPELVRFGFTKDRLPEGVDEVIVEARPSDGILPQDQSVNTQRGLGYWHFILSSGLLAPKVEGLDADAPALLWAGGKNSVKSILEQDEEPACQLLVGLLGCTKDIAHEVYEQCEAFDGRRTRAQLFKTKLPEFNVSTHASSSSQTDTDVGGHPQKVSEWEGFPDDVKRACSLLNDTDAFFAHVPSTLGAGPLPHGKPASVSALDRAVFTPLTELLCYALSVECQSADMFQWVVEPTATPSDSQVEREEQLQRALRSAGPETDAPAPRSVTTAALLLAVGSVPDFVLWNVATKQRRMIKVAERVERLRGAVQLSVVEIWNGRIIVTEALLKNVVGVIAQVNRHCAATGCKYAAFGTYEYTWFVYIERPQEMKIAGPYYYKCQNPSILQMYYVLGMRSITEELHDIWHPSKAAFRLKRPSNVTGLTLSETPGGPVTRSSMSDSSRKASKSARRDMNSPGSSISKQQSGVQSSWEIDHRGQSPAAVLPKPEKPQRATVDDAVLAAAAQVDIRRVLAFVGYGVSGDVFLYRLNGRFVALKIAAMHSKEAERLALEGANLKAVQSLWGQYVPALAALGPTGRRDAFVLATEYIRGRHLGSGTEEPLKQQLQAALEAVHQLEVLHGDLRSQNVVVSGEGEQQHVWLIDFGHSKQHATQVERQEEMQQLDELFA